MCMCARVRESVCVCVIFPPNDLLHAWHQNLHQLPSRKETTKGNPRGKNLACLGEGEGAVTCLFVFQERADK